MKNLLLVGLILIVGCAPRVHVHKPVCWHINPDMTTFEPCSFPYEQVKNSKLHCDLVRCKLCGQWMKK